MRNSKLSNTDIQYFKLETKRTIVHYTSHLEIIVSERAKCWIKMVNVFGIYFIFVNCLQIIEKTFGNFKLFT